MSSDGSVASTLSRIRQFGLYRTIDARTEEFIKASRKRQIRQGCACAAVSTAITVTIVVSVILVYEYGINGQSRRNQQDSLKPNWVGLINDSSDIMLLDTKFTKKINFDKTTLKLLPILLRALNKNKYLEKLLEENSTPHPAFDKKLTTEFILKKNVFSDKNNWAKFPTSKLYATEYKLSPIMIKMPSTSVDYFKKRKIRDYKRMLNYFDKMISEKVGYSQQLLKKEYANSKLMLQIGSLKNESFCRKSNYSNSRITNSTPSTTENPAIFIKKFMETKKENTTCKCSKTLWDMLSKFLDSLKKLIPNILPTNTSCENKSKEHSTILSEKPIHSLPIDLTYTTSIPKTHEQPQFVPGSIKHVTEKHQPPSFMIDELFNSISKNKYFQKIYLNNSTTNKQSLQSQQQSNQNLKNDNKSSIQRHLNPMYDTTLSTSTISPIVDEDIDELISSSSEKIMETSTTSSMTTYTAKYDDEFLNYETASVKYDTDLAEDALIAQKGHTGRKHKLVKNKPNNLWHSFRKHGTLDLKDYPDQVKKKLGTSNFKEIKHIIQLKPDKTQAFQSTTEAGLDVSTATHRSSTSYGYILERYETTAYSMITNLSENEDHLENMILETSTEKLQTSVPQAEVLNNETIIENILEVDTDKIMSQEDYQEEVNLKKSDSIFDNTLPYNKPINDYFEAWEDAQDRKYSRSMLPHIRPPHLEIKRSNDWKHDSGHDYNDGRFSNYGFDLLNI